jgi:WD40 repeat protein
VSARLPATATLQAPPTSPYKGLAAFDDSELDEQLFFGREHERAVIAANIVASRLTVLYGPSGVGKSSIVRAGVARDLRVLAAESLVVVCDTWSGHPASALAEAVASAASIEAGSLADTIEVAVAEHYELYLLLDQVEEYFVYHGSDPALGDALAELVTRPELSVHVLVTIREDALARLDAFKRRLPGLLANRLQLDPLSVDAGRQAIVGPVERFATLSVEKQTVEVEPELVEAVLAGVTTGAVIEMTRGRGAAGAVAGQARIETPYLQVVMQRIWEVERADGSDVLRLRTLELLGGPSRIVGEHLERALGTLSPQQQARAASVFNYLVTPSGTKIAHRTRDLARYLAVPQAELEVVLGALARERILRPVETPDSEPAYEIFHDVLADAVLAWRAAFEARAALEREQQATRRRRRRLLIIFLIAALALATMGAVTVYALSQRDNAQRNAAAAQVALDRARKANDRARSKTRQTNLAVIAQRHQAKLARDAAARATAEAHAATVARAKATAAARKANRAAVTAANEAAKAKRATALERASERNATAQATRATRDELRARQASQRASAAERRAEHQRSVAVRALKAAETARAKALASERVVASEASAYRSQAALPSAPETSLELAVRAATLDPKLSLVESTLRAALLAARNLRVLRTGDMQTRSASFSPDGALILTAGDAGARIFRAGSGEPVGTLATGRPVDGSAFSHDGHTIVTAEKGRAELWDADARTRRKALFQEGASTGATFSDDGQRLLTSGAKSARVWSTATGAPVSRRLSFPANVTAAAIDPSGSRFAIATGGAAGVYDSGSSTLIFPLTEPSAVNGMRFSPTGDTIATAGADGVARLWNTQDGSERCATRPSDGDLTSLVFSHDGASLLTVDVQGDTRIWSVSTCAEETQLIGHLSKVVGADFSPDDQYVVTAGADRTARIYSLPDGTPQATLLGHSEALRSVAFGPDGTKVVTAASDGTARVWDARVDRPEQPLGAHTGTAGGLAISPGARTLASVGSDGYLRLWNLETRQPREPIAVGVPLDDVAFSADGKIVAAAGADGTTRLWNTSTGALVVQFSQTGAVRALALSPDGKWLATAGSDNVARVFALHGSGDAIALQHVAVVDDVAFSRDGRYLATATADGLARTWQVGSWAPAVTFTGHRAAVNAVSFSPDGTLLVTASLDHTARVWNVATGKTVRVLEGHAGSVSDAAFSADGRWIVTAGPRTGGVWSATAPDLPNSTDRLFFVSDGHQRIAAVTFAPSGWMLATAAANGDVATYTCALCAGTPELLQLATQRIAQLNSR